MRDRSADVLLTDGTTVHLRQIQPGDAEGIVAMHSRFSERTRYLRYFSPYPRIPERDLQRFVNVDHDAREAFVIQTGGRILAVGRYERLGPEAADAEVALVVEDAYQGRGIGSVLLEHLAAAARDAGISRFVAEVLPENSAMLRVFADAGYQVQRQYADGVVHLTFPIALTEQSLEVQWRREQRAEARSIARLLSPRGVAVYGASASGHGIGAAILGHLRDGGFTGAVHPIHPSADTVGGLPALRSARLAEDIDLAVVAVPPAGVRGVVDDAAAAGVHGLVVVSAGFGETGTDAGIAAERELIRAAHAAGMRVVGPNCLGVANTHEEVRLNATLAPWMPRRGRAGFFSQSGALGVALLAEADRRGLGLSSFVSAGNRADVSGNDLLQYWEDDPATDVVLLYLETFGNPRKFARLARRIGRTKPIVAVASAARAAGAAGPDRAGVAALFAHAGVIRVETVAELFDVGVLLAHQPLPTGRRVGIVGNSTALTRLAAAACADGGLAVAEGYPRDVPPQAGAHDFGDVLAEAATDAGVDALVVAVAPPVPGQLSDEDADFAAALASVALAGDKPTVVTSLVDQMPAGVAAYPSVEEAVRALSRACGYADWLRRPPGTVPEVATVDSFDVLTAYGIEVAPSLPAESADEAVAAADRLGYPVALKSAGEELRHRLDLGAVRLDLTDESAVARAYAEMAERFGPGVLVQAMVPPGVACVVELVEDPAFGPVVGFGLGGVATDLLGDRAWRPAPLTDRDAAAMVDEPRAAPLLRGYRGAEPVDREALAQLLIRVGRLADERPEVRELRLNPVLARPDGVSVLHAEVVLGPPADRPDTAPRSL
ncbi:bifunctional GNAT family N-acetyltransferase/acetate--CoA ligase family protein [Phytohabitans houttuyneae]|uniref:GNAT family N-acetyltransferase n=1 Tax=Phytohabitans houttuyneae TaxID=1076126 RepID=A0A6V8JYF4_9ACTN|nr:GNAT family N-acetyltransferase [Phytohabitans houttuyneae]